MRSIRIRQKPIKPKRKKDIVEKLTINGDMSLQTVIDWVLARGGKVEDAFFDHDYGYDYSEVSICLKRDETSAEWQARLAHYDQRMAAYEEWYSANKAEIEAELERREQAKAIKHSSAIASYQREIERLQKEMHKLM